MPLLVVLNFSETPIPGIWSLSTPRRPPGCIFQGAPSSQASPVGAPWPGGRLSGPARRQLCKRFPLHGTPTGLCSDLRARELQPAAFSVRVQESRCTGPCDPPDPAGAGQTTGRESSCRAGHPPLWCVCLPGAWSEVLLVCSFLAEVEEKQNSQSEYLTNALCFQC